ncbi:MAG: 3-dehydroquinate synthase, partial [Bacteroidales bacterium]|nr:3-dehydroquinate synthase [Bacteroidales bacterium]
MVAQRIILGAGLADLAALLSDEREVFVVCDKAVCKNGLFCTPDGAGGPVVGKNGPFCTPVDADGPVVGKNGLFCTRVDEALRLVLGERLKGWYELEASEGAKDIETVMEIERAMMEAGVSRGGLVLSVGGGITTDIGGFAASIYKRGIRFANVPTTLLAMVDAAIGGKTGVNLDGYKNMVGVIRQPEFVYIDPAFLQTLPEREVRCGLAEMLKTFLLSDAGLFEEAVAALPEIPARLILEAGRIKEAIVAEDPFESGRRTILNLGHTFAHAIERCSREPAAEDAAAGQGPVAPATEDAAAG